MSRSYRKSPFTKGNHASWKEDRTISNRLYRRFYKAKIKKGEYDDIHNRNEIFWDRWTWSPDYFTYFGDYKNPKMTWVWYFWYRVNKGDNPDKVVEEMLNEQRENYKKMLRK